MAALVAVTATEPAALEVAEQQDSHLGFSIHTHTPSNIRRRSRGPSTGRTRSSSGSSSNKQAAYERIPSDVFIYTNSNQTLNQI